MTDKSKRIFENEISKKDYKKALRSKEKFIKKFGDDSDANYAVSLVPNDALDGAFGLYDVRLGEDAGSAASASAAQGADWDMTKGLIVGNIRMGFGHYRMSLAIASAAASMGYIPYWMDLNSYPHTTCTKIISAQNDLYSMGSRISQKSRLFNKAFWEPLNYEGFRRLSYNASDQKNAELMATVFKNVPKDIPLIGTHVWPCQAAIHAGMKYVVNAIPDNWAMALHLAEGSLHVVQTENVYYGYRTLNGMSGNKILKPIPEDDIKCVGHYIDHELVANIEADCKARKDRLQKGDAVRYLLTIGGAGAQKELFKAIIKHLMPEIKRGRAVLYINVGDYRKVWDDLKKSIPELKDVSKEHMDNWKETVDFCKSALGDSNISGVHAFWHRDIFQAVYATNLLMRSADVTVTKPGELAFYPVPKLFLKRIGGHERWSAVHSSEIGDGTPECRDTKHTLQIIDLIQSDGEIISKMCDNIIRNKEEGIYDGAYNAVKEAFKLREK